MILEIILLAFKLLFTVSVSSVYVSPPHVEIAVVFIVGWSIRYLLGGRARASLHVNTAVRYRL